MRMPWTAEARLARSEKGLSSALAGEQTLGDGFGLITSHMFGGAVVGGGGNVALHANSGDKVNGTANYGTAFMSGAIAGAVAGGGAGVYRAKGAKKFSEARIAKAEQKYDESLARFANKKDSSGHSINEIGEMYKETKREARETKRRSIMDPLKGPKRNDIDFANSARRNTRDVVMDRLDSADISDASRKKLKQGIFTSKVKTDTPLINPRQAVNTSYMPNGRYAPNMATNPNAVNPINPGGFNHKPGQDQTFHTLADPPNPPMSPWPKISDAKKELLKRRGNFGDKGYL